MKSFTKYINEDKEFDSNIQGTVEYCVDYILRVKWGDELDSPSEYGADNIEKDREILSKSLYSAIHKIM